MMNAFTRKMLSRLVLFLLLSLTLTTPAYAYDGRGGDKVVIQAGQVINDDLYVGANEFTLDGTVNGDTVAFGQKITVNGTINGDLITAAQTVVVNGTVSGNVRMAGSVLFVGSKSHIGGDLLGAAYSLELQQGSSVGRDLVFATGQTLLGADVARNVIAYTGALELNGKVGGNVTAHLGEASQGKAGPPPTMFMGPTTVNVPIVAQGLTVDPAAKIAGNLEYTQNVDLSIPAGVVAGKVTRTAQPVEENQPAPEKTDAQKVAEWAWQTGRSLVTLVLIGLCLLWLFPIFTQAVSDKLTGKPWPSLAWGVVTYAGFFFVLMLIVFVTVLGAIIFGLLTLGGLSGTIVVLGLLSLFAVIVAFVLATTFISKIMFGEMLGKWILAKTNSPIANHRYWPMVIGVAITVFVIAILSFPLLPGFLGWLLNLVIILFGLGALWQWGREKLLRKQNAPTAA